MSLAVRRTETHGDGDATDMERSGVAEMEAVAKYFRRSGWLNRLGAGLLVIPALPIIVVLVFLVRLTSYGPGIYRQRRVGRSGRTFTLYKIRTMMHNAEALTGPVWTAPNDPRITKFGKLLRATHLDELPQLLNVLCGHMALIGPRPERPEFTQCLASEIPGYMDRYVIPPGITGLAQINLPPDTDVDSVRRKLVLDLEYTHGANGSMDMRILLCTAVRLFGLPGMSVARKLGLLRDPEIPTSMRHGAAIEGASPIFPSAVINEPHIATGGNGAGGNGVHRTALRTKDRVSTA